VLLNARKHHASRSPTVPPGFIDACSSAPRFDGFHRPGELAFGVCSRRPPVPRLLGEAPDVKPPANSEDSTPPA